MPHIRIVLVEPLYEGNVGFAARVMKNFGFTDMVLINPCTIGNEAKIRASHADDVLLNATTMTLDEVFATSHRVVATTGSLSYSACHPTRMPFYSPKELRHLIGDLEGTISILFGRENWGLSNEEVRRADIICTIPTSPIYPIINLSHAVGVICYELANLPKAEIPLATVEEMDHLYDHIDQYLDLVDHPGFKRESTMTLIRRVLGRCNLTWRECSTIHGLLRRSEWHIIPSDNENLVRSSEDEELEHNDKL
ncbi:RNA methyltransferase [Methanospirillum purgamenti]|jgi:TrmH family RNA methyltransferase|uniref:RNA methyltransferase n=1 Tax=Methanospirillum hungatei TaxID=2203 RepID=A0A8F5VLY4_METHU|nr:RNA methyltransferase [Methanospirillum hungatei]NLW76814.1 RNA methyltransferase [Methanomicrobiales archaeon]QXO95506.1 RNA methyltransferase [Methanospirillum hungatei]